MVSKIELDWGTGGKSFPYCDIIRTIIDANSTGILRLFLLLRDLNSYSRNECWTLGAIPDPPQLGKFLHWPNIKIYHGEFPEGKDTLRLDMSSTVAQWEREWLLTGPKKKWNNAEAFYCKQEEIAGPRWLRSAWMYRWTDDVTARDYAYAFTCPVPDIKIEFANSTQDYIDMYAIKCEGCHGHHNKEYASSIRTYMLKEHGLWPSIWHHYQDNIQGCFVRNKDGEMVARFFLTKETGNEDWQWYSYCRGSDKEVRSKVQAWCTHSPYKARDGVKRLADMTVPGIKWKDTYICPIPFMDDMEPGPESVIYMWRKDFGKFFITPNMESAKKAEKLGYVFLHNRNDNKKAQKYLYNTGGYVAVDGTFPESRQGTSNPYVRYD